MKRVVLVSLCLSIAASASFAADMVENGPATSGAVKRKKVPNIEIDDVYVPPPPPPKWTGFYGGINIGAGWGASSYSWNAWYNDGLNGGISNNLRYGSGISLGVVGGGQLGYNYEIPGLKIAGIGFVTGGEVDFQGTSMGANSTTNGYQLNVNNQNTSYIATQVNGPLYVSGFMTARGRLGLLLAPTFLVYGTGGFAYANIARNGAGFSLSGSQTGWSAGGGMEFLLSPAWSMKMEYLYTNVAGTFSKYINNYSSTVYPLSNHNAWNTVRLGLNYHLDFNPSPLIVNVNVGPNEPPKQPPPKQQVPVAAKY